MQQKRHEVEAEQNKNEKPTEAQERIERKLRKHRIKYATNKLNRPEPWGKFLLLKNDEKILLNR